MTVTVNFIGVPPSALAISAVVVDLEYHDPAGDTRFDQATSLLITDDTSSFTQEWKVRLPRRQDTTYRWKMTLLRADGSQVSSDFKNDNHSRLILRLPPL